MQLKNFLKKFIVRYSLFLAGIMIGLGCMALSQRVFVYKNISIVGATAPDRDRVTKAIVGKSVFVFPAQKIEEVVRVSLPTSADITAHVTLPSSLSIEVRYKKAFAALATDKGYLYVSNDGMIIKKDREHDKKTPIIHNNFQILHNEYQMGQTITFTSIGRALQAIQVLTAEGLIVDSIDIDSVDMIACKTRTIEVVFSQTRDFALQTHEMRQIVRRLRLGDLKIEAIDLRFDKPIVRTK